MENKKQPFKINIEYCGAKYDDNPYYQKLAEKLTEEIKQKWPGVQIELKAQDPKDKTGNFEVTIYSSKHQNGYLFHSKKKGQGRIDQSNSKAFLWKMEKFLKVNQIQVNTFKDGYKKKKEKNEQKESIFETKVQIIEDKEKTYVQQEEEKHQNMNNR